MTAESLLPIVLAMLMFGMGLALTLEDFRRVLAFPARVVLGLVGVLVVMPLVAVALIALLRLEPPTAVGLLLLAICPGGLMSNVYSYYGRGDLALSITMTAIGSVAAVFSIPLLLDQLLASVVAGGAGRTLSAGDMMEQLALITLLPVCCGVGLRHLMPALALRTGGTIRNIASLAIIALFLVAAYDQRAALLGALSETAVAVAIFSGIAVLVATIGCTLLGVDRPSRLSIQIEHIVRQEGTGIFLATSVLGMPEAALPLLTNSLIGPIVGLMLIAWSLRGSRDAANPEEAGAETSETAA